MRMNFLKLLVCLGCFVSVSSAFIASRKACCMIKDSSFSKLTMRTSRPLLPLNIKGGGGPADNDPQHHNSHHELTPRPLKKDIWGEYMHQLTYRPILTKSCTCCAIATIGTSRPICSLYCYLLVIISPLFSL